MALSTFSGSCRKSDSRRDSSSARPNILWIVWDTVRKDHLSLYGYDKPTTPFLKSWAQGALVFDNCISVANCTVPSHASMFTGLMPSEHYRHNRDNYLGDSFVTVAEILRNEGYQTYMFSENPHISRKGNFSQGFDAVEHPWSKKYKDEAIEIVRRKVTTQDRSSEFYRTIRFSNLTHWTIKASGELVQRGLEEWLRQYDRDRPFFAFLNYMEAHRPYIPLESYRKQVMNAEQVKKSYKVDRSWEKMWSYTFGQTEYTDEEIELTRLTYDATLVELDRLFKGLLVSLKKKGYLDNTVVVLTSDHGEHL